MITQLDIQMFYDETWKPIYFGVIGQGVTNGHGSLHLLASSC